MPATRRQRTDIGDDGVKRGAATCPIGIVMTDGTLDTTFCGDGMVERSFETREASFPRCTHKEP